LIEALARRFGTDFNGMNLRQYAPGEGAEIIRPLLMLFGRRPYLSLTVSKLAAAVQCGHWQDR
jgi:hypothetical protein